MEDFEDLKQYDGKYVRITDPDGTAFEGYCSYNTAEYNESEFGRNEEGVQIPYMLFRRRDIARIESLEGREGPWGCFSEPYGALEEMAFEDGETGVDEILSCEDDEHILRMLRCLAAHFAEGGVPDREGILRLLRSLIRTTENDTVRAEAEKISG